MSTATIDFWDVPPVNAIDDNGNAARLDSAGNPILYGTGPTYAANQWDLVFIGGVPVPGVCKIHGLPTLAFDKKKSGGVDGAVITVNGYIPGPIEIEVLLWTQEQWQFFQVLAGQIWRKPAKKTKAKDIALTIDHPGLQLWGISSVVIIGVSVPEIGPSRQTRVIKIKCVEFVAQAKGATRTAVAPVPVAEEVRTSGAANGLVDPPSATNGGPRGRPPQTLPTGG